MRIHKYKPESSLKAQQESVVSSIRQYWNSINIIHKHTTECKSTNERKTKIIAIG